jgi:hypothetical protein
MKKHLSKKRVVLAALVVVMLAIASGVAYAYWTAGGGGPGSATAGTTSSITVNQTNSAITNLYPGGPAQALSGTFTNPNPGQVQIASVTAVVSSVTPLTGHTLIGDGTPDCVAGDFYITGSFAGPYTVPTGTGGAWNGISVGMVNRNGTAAPPTQISPAANQDNCKGATVNITYTVS